METSLLSCGHTFTSLGVPIAGELEEVNELKNLFKWAKFPFCVMVDRKIFTYLKNKRLLLLIVNKKIQDFRYLNGAIHHVIVNGAVFLFKSLIVWNNPFGFDAPLTENPGD